MGSGKPLADLNDPLLASLGYRRNAENPNEVVPLDGTQAMAPVVTIANGRPGISEVAPGGSLKNRELLGNERLFVGGNLETHSPPARLHHVLAEAD